MVLPFLLFAERLGTIDILLYDSQCELYIMEVTSEQLAVIESTQGAQRLQKLGVNIRDLVQAGMEISSIDLDEHSYRSTVTLEETSGCIDEANLLKYVTRTIVTIYDRDANGNNDSVNIVRLTEIYRGKMNGVDSVNRMFKERQLEIVWKKERGHDFEVQLHMRNSFRALRLSGDNEDWRFYGFTTFTHPRVNDSILLGGYIAYPHRPLDDGIGFWVLVSEFEDWKTNFPDYRQPVYRQIDR